MNTATHTNRIARSAAVATLVAAVLAGCATQASAPAEPVEKPAVVVPLLVPNDNDPRGLHGPLVIQDRQEVHRLLVRAAADRYIAELLVRARLASRADPGSVSPPEISSPVNDIDPRGHHGVPKGPR